MKRLGIVLTILTLLVVGLGQPTLAGNNLEHETWNLERSQDVERETWNLERTGDNVWTPCSQGMWGIADVQALAISPGYATDSTLYAGTRGGGVFKSTDGGASWIATSLTNLGVYVVNTLALSPGYASDRTIFAGTVLGVFKSTDGGASWSTAGLTNLDIDTLALSPGYSTD